MPSIPRLVAILTLPVAAAAAAAQESRPAGPAVDSVAEAGRREGYAAANTPNVGGNAALGVLTGFVAGAAGIPLVFGGESLAPRALGLAAVLAAVSTVAAAGAGRPSPPPDVEQRIQDQPPAYVEAFKAAYASRLAARRQRAAAIGGAVGGAVGLATFVALVVGALSTLDY